MKPIRSSEITPEWVYLNRRQFMKAGFSAAAGAVLAACAPSDASAPALTPTTGPAPVAAAQTDDLGDPINSFEDITSYNNFYEFSMNKEGIGRLSSKFKTSPWQVEVSGLVGSPKTYDIDDLRKKFPSEERVYRLRCVEGWSMVIPWLGFPLNKLLKDVEVRPAAKYVRFTTLLDESQMPGQRDGYFSWPYVEGLRVDEAMHDLTLMATGLYGRDLLGQNGAPLRLAVPWKYGFKSIKSIVKIELVEEMPVSLWMNAAPDEYGFYANVNPEVAHPRWSQDSERRIGELNRRATLKFNGYEDEVAGLYAGMDLKANY